MGNEEVTSLVSTSRRAWWRRGEPHVSTHDTMFEVGVESLREGSEL